MSRPGDWSPLGLHGDPTPGDPDVLQSVYQQMDDLGSLAREVTSGLNQVLNQSGDGFIGKTAEAVRKKIDGHLKRFIDSVGDSFGVSAPATMDYLNAVREAQSKADQALSAAQGLSKDDPKLEPLKSQVHQAQQDYDSAVNTYIGKLSDASHMIQQPISGWQLFLQALGILAMILAVLGAIFGGWVGLIAMAVNVALLIKTAVEFAEGKASVLDLVLAVIGVLFPSTKGLNIGSIGKDIFSALKNLPKAVMSGIGDVGRGLGHFFTNPGVLGNVFHDVTALPGLALNGLKSLGNLALTGGRLALGALRSIGGAFRNDFALATIGIKGTLPKIGVYAISAGSRFLVSATLPLDFFELGVGARAAIKMGLGTRLTTPWAHLSQPVAGGATHVAGLATGHEGFTPASNGAAGFGGPAHPGLGGLSGTSLGGLHGADGSGLGALHGLNSGMNLTGLHGLNTGMNLGGLHGLNTVGAVHLGAGVTPGSLSHAVSNLGSGASAVDHLTALDHATGFDRTASGLLEPSATHLGGISLGSDHFGSASVGSVNTASSHLGVSSVHTGRADLTGSATGLHTSIGDGMSGIRSAAGHVADFHALGLPELKSIVDGDVSVARFTPDGVSLHVGGQTGTPTALHLDFRTMSLKDDAGHQVVVAPEVHTALGTEAKAPDGHAPGETPAPAPSVNASHAAPSPAPAQAATPTPLRNAAPPAGDVRTAAGAGHGLDELTGSDLSSTGGTGHDLDELSGGGAPSTGRGAGLAEDGGRFAEGPAIHSATAQSDHLGVSAQDGLDLAGRRTGTGDSAGAATPSVREPEAGADAIATVVTPGHVALRPSPQPHAGSFGGARPPRSRFEAVTGGVGGRVGAERMAAWNKYEKASADASAAEGVLHDLGGRLDKPSDTIDQAAARLDAHQAGLGVDAARQDLARLGMDVDAIRARLDQLMTPPPATADTALAKVQVTGETRRAEWTGFREQRDGELHVQLTVESGFERATGDLAAEADRGFARFVADDLFGGRYLKDDRFEGQFLKEGQTPRALAEDSYRRQLHDAYQQLADRTKGGVVPDSQWRAVHGELHEAMPLHFHRIAQRERAVDMFEQDFTRALEDFRKEDLFGGRYLPPEDDRFTDPVHGAGSSDDLLEHAERTDAPSTLHDIRLRMMLKYGRAVDQAFTDQLEQDVTRAVDKALGTGDVHTTDTALAGSDASKAAGHSAGGRGLSAGSLTDEALNGLRADLAHEIQQLSERERWVQHATGSLDREIEKGEDDLTGASPHLDEDAQSWARTSFEKDLRNAHATLHGPSDSPAQGLRDGRAWESYVGHATTEQALSGRLQYAEFRQFRMSEAQRAYDHALADFDENHLLTEGELSGPQRERLLQEWNTAVEKAVEDHWFGHAGQGDFRVSPAGDAGRALGSRPWAEAFEELKATLHARFSHELQLEDALSQAAREFHGIVGHPDSLETFRNTVREETVDQLGKDFRAHTVEAYDRIWSQVEHDIKAWLTHEASHENLFHDALTARTTAPLERPSFHAEEPAHAAATPAVEGADHTASDHAVDGPVAGDAEAVPAAAHSSEQVQADVVHEQIRPSRPEFTADQLATDARTGHAAEQTSADGTGAEQVQEQIRREGAQRIGNRLAELLKKHIQPRPPFHAGPVFDARRVEQHDGFETTELKVRIAFTGESAGHGADGVLQQIRKGVATRFNGVGPSSYGGRLHITVQQVPLDQDPHLTVELVDHDRAMDSHAWWQDAQPDEYARQLGAHIGLLQHLTDDSPPSVPVAWHTFEERSLAQVLDHPFVIDRTEAADGSATTHVQLMVELPDMRYQPRSVRENLQTQVRNLVTGNFGGLVSHLAGQEATTLSVDFARAGRGALVRFVADETTGAWHMETSAQELVSQLSDGLGHVPAAEHGPGWEDTADLHLDTASDSGAASPAVSDDGTLVGTGDDLTVVNGTSGGAQLLESLGLKKPASGPLQTPGDIAAWLAGVNRGVDADKAALFDPAARFPTEIVAHPVLIDRAEHALPGTSQSIRGVVVEADLTDAFRERLNRPELLNTEVNGKDLPGVLKGSALRGGKGRVRIGDLGLSDVERARLVLHQPGLDRDLAAALGRPEAGRDLAAALVKDPVEQADLALDLAAALGRPEWAHALEDPGLGKDLARAVGKPALGTKLVKALETRLKGVQKKVLWQPGYATGDQFGIAAALMGDKDLHVVVVTKIPGRELQDKGPAIRDFYLDSGIDRDRVHLVEVRGNEKAAAAAERQALTILDVEKLSKKQKDTLLLPVAAGTTWVAENFTVGVRREVRAHWGLDETGFSASEQVKVGQWLGRQGIVPSADRDTIVLWSRFSGKKGDVHVEHDTSYEGVRQILDELNVRREATGGKSPLVIIAGDAFADAAHDGKYTTIAADMKARGLDVHDLTNFWQRDKAGIKTWGGDTRIGQMRLYEHLRRTSNSVRHLGFRSGNLEAMALSGHAVRYLEEPDSVGGTRMAKWHAAQNSLLTAKNGSKGLSLASGYERILVTAPPTRSGKYIFEKMKLANGEAGRSHADMKNLLHPNWVHGAQDRVAKPADIRSKTKGFDSQDLQKITDYLAGPHPVMHAHHGPATSPTTTTTAGGVHVGRVRAGQAVSPRAPLPSQVTHGGPAVHDAPQAVGGLRTAPKEFLAGNAVLLRMEDGMRARTPALDVDHKAFLQWMDHQDRHWFTLTRNPAATAGDQNVYLLTPAIEKYAHEFGDDPDLQTLIGDRALPAVQGDDHYVQAHYVPYFQGKTSDPEHTVGHTEIPLEATPHNFSPDFVFTGAMNGCALTVTKGQTEGTFTAWHYQSPTSNRAESEKFRLGKHPTDWFGDAEYQSLTPNGIPETTNVLWRGDNGWEILSQENHAHLHNADNTTLNQFRHRPIHFDPGHAWTYTTKLYLRMAEERLTKLTRVETNDLPKLDKGTGNLNLRSAFDLTKAQAERDVHALRHITGPDNLLTTVENITKDHQDTTHLVTTLLDKQNKAETTEANEAAKAATSAWAWQKKPDTRDIDWRRGQIRQFVTEASDPRWLNGLRTETTALATPAPPHTDTVAPPAPLSSTGSHDIPDLLSPDHPLSAQSPQWQAARNAVEPVTRNHFWVDPISRPLGPDTQTRQARYEVASSFDARRFHHGDDTVTDLTIKIHLNQTPDMPPQDVDALWNRAQLGVDRLFNAPGHRLPNNDLLHVTLERADAADAHLNVTVARSGTPSDQYTWSAHATDQDLAHELGHQLGLRDEYRDATAPQRPQVTGSLMGDYHLPAPAGLDHGGLRGRHLQLLHAHIGDLDHPTTPHTTAATTTGISPHAPRQQSTDPTTSRARPVGGLLDADLTDAFRERLNSPELLSAPVGRDDVSGLVDPSRFDGLGATGRIRVGDLGLTDLQRAHLVVDNPELDPVLAAALGRPEVGRDLAEMVVTGGSDRAVLGRDLAAALGRPAWAGALDDPELGRGLAAAVGRPELGDALVTALRNRPEPAKRVLVQPGYATGDQFGIAAALIADKDLHVVVVTRIPGRELQDKGPAIERFYLESGIDSDRVHLVDVQNDEKVSAAGERKASAVLGIDTAQLKRRQKDALILPVAAGTTWVAENFNVQVRRAIRQHWKLDDAGFPAADQAELGSWLKDKGIDPSPDRDTIILWSRFSGKKGDVHVEHDTSYQGVRQILDQVNTQRKKAGGRGPLVVIAGDAFSDVKHMGKYAEIVDGMRAEGLDVHDLTNFWEGNTDGIRAWGGETRIGQMRLYEYLRRTSGSARHLGFRSGNLEAMALSGHTVRYMEEPDSVGGSRMAKWHAGAMDNTLLTEKLGKDSKGFSLASGYERIVVSAPPTRSGKYIFDAMKVRRARDGRKADLNDLLHPKWVGKSAIREDKPDDIRSKAKGFNAQDLQDITRYLTRPQATIRPQREHAVPGTAAVAPGPVHAGDLSTGQFASPRAPVPPAATVPAPGGTEVLDAPAAVREFTAAPTDFLAGSTVLLRMEDGMRARTPGLDMDYGAFLRWMDKQDRHWFALTPHAGDHGGRPAYLLTPAVEKYALEFGADPELRALLGSQGLPAVRDADTYLAAHYVPYFQGRTADPQTQVGHTVIPREATGDFKADFVFTAAMNGCAFVVTKGPDEGRFTAWHYQSPTSNRVDSEKFRLEQQPSDWFGDGEYQSLGLQAVPESTNFMWRGDQGWEFISQENHASFTNADDVRTNGLVSRPVHFAPGHEWSYVARFYQRTAEDRLEKLARVEGDHIQRLSPSPAGLHLKSSFSLMKLQAERDVRALGAVTGPEDLAATVEQLAADHAETARLMDSFHAQQERAEEAERKAAWAWERQKLDEADRLRGQIRFYISDLGDPKWLPGLQRESAAVLPGGAGAVPPPAPAAQHVPAPVNPLAVAEVSPARTPLDLAPQWHTARSAAAPVPRSRTWVDPVSRPAGSGRHAPRYAVSSSFDARQFPLGPDRVTDLTVRVLLAGTQGVSPQDVDALWNRALEGVSRVFNAPGHRLPNGDLLHVTLERADAADAHLEVTVAAPRTATAQNVWARDATAQDLAHEIGHQLGLRDEYRDTTAPQRPQVTGSLMGDYHLPAPAGLDHGGLRGRHLQLLHAHIGDLDHPATPHTTAATTATGISPHAPRWESTQSRPAALESTRPYDRAGGLRRPSALEQQRLEQVFPRTGDGAFQRFPDPRGHAFQLAAPIRAYNRTNPRNAFLTDLGNADWVRRVNGGWGVDEARLYNCLDVAASVLASWHGRPTVAAAVHDAGSGLQVEERGTDRVGNWLDAGWRIHRAPDGAAPRPSQVWNAVADRLRTGGHGSSAIVVFRRPNGNNHAVNAVNHHGRILWIDAQRGRVSEKPLYRGTSFMSIELGPDFRPIDRVPTLREAYAYPRPTHPRTAPATAPKQRPMTAESTVALPAGDTPAPLTVETGPAAGDWAAGVATALDKAAAAVTVTAAEAEEFARIRAERPAALDADPETRTVHSVPASQSESAADLPARPPWYVGRGMLGETAVSGVAEWDAAEAATWADDLTEDLDAPVRTQAAAALRDMLAENRPETWRELLVYGRAVNAGGRVLWLRPVLADPSELAVDETAAGPVREYRVQWSSTAVDSFRSRMSSTALEAILFAALTIGSSAASTLVLGVPRITAESAAEASEASAHNLITGRKVFVDGTTRFAGGLRMRIFVDGAEHTPDRTVPRGLVVEFPSVFTGPHEPEARAVADAAGETPLGTARPRPAGEVLNAIDVTPVVARLHRQLRGAGLSAQTVLAVSADAQKLINEPTFRDRSRILLTGGDPSNEIRHGEKLAGLGGFRGHFRTRITLSGAQLLDVTDDVKVRDDLGTGSSATFGAGGESSAALTFGLNAAGLVDPALQAPDHRTIAKGLAPLAALTLSGGRSWDYSLASQALAHTVLNTRAPHARYGAELTVTLDWISSTHPGLGSMSSAVRGDLGVPWRDGQGAADFERRALGGVRSPHVRDAIGGPHPLPGPVAAQPHVRALLQISEAPPVRHEVVPRRLASWRPAPHPDEPLALGRDSLGFAVAAALPGAELVEGYFRWRLETLSGRESSRVDWAALDRRLLVLFGRTALEGDLGNVLAGLLHHVTVGNRRFVLAVRAHLLDRRRTTPHTMTVNNRAALSETLDSRREGRWAVTVGGGGAVRLKLLDQLLLQLGGFRLQGRIAGGKGESFASVTTSYRRKETVGDTVESVRDVVYELTLRSADGGRPFHERVWLDMPEDLLAQVLVPREHVPTAPVTAEELLQAGTVTYLRRWPDTAEPHVDLSRGASGLYPAFLTMPQLTHLAAKRYFEINRLPWTEDWTRWPEAVLTATRPSDLAAYFGLMTDPIGREVALPEHDGWTNTLTIKLRGHAPRQLETAGEGPEIEDYNRDISRHATSKGTVTSLSVQALAGPQVRFGSDTGGDVEVSGGDTGDGHADARQPGGRVVAAVQAEAGTQWGRSHETDEGSAEISRATYGGAKHTYRADPVFELTFTRRKGGRVQTDTRYIRVKDGMDLLVPERRVADILPAERGTATADAQRQGAPAEPAAGAQERPRRAYVGGRLPVTSAWPEVLHADDVLEQIISRLRDRRILPPAGVTGGKEQERLLGALRTKFRSEALKNGHGALLDQGRWAWFPVSGFAGSTRYLWVRVYAERIDPAHAHRPRPEVKLTLRGESVREDKDVTLRSTSAGFGGVATARGGEHEEHEEHGGQQGHAGFDYGGGYLWRNGRSETVNTKHTDIIRANPKDTSEEFEHAVHFRVELATTRELPQLLEPVVTPAATHGHALYTAAADAVSSWLDPASVTRRARPDQVWRKPAPWTWHDDGSGEGRGISGEIRFLVPGRLTTAAPAVGTAPLPFTRVYGQNARWEAAGAGSRFRQPPKALVDNLHPWDIPAAGAAQRWTKVAAIGSVQPPDLARDGVWTIPGIDFGTKEGIAYQHHTSHAMLRPSIVELLTNRYLVVVGGRQVRLGMEVARAHPLDIADVLFKARRYQQDDTHEEVKVDQAKGWYHGGGPESGGNAGDNAVLERTPLERHTMDVQRQGGGFSETEEFNREGTRSFRSYRFDVTLVAEAVDGPARRLRVDVPGGVYGMIPLAADGTLADGLDAVALFGPPRTTFADVVEQYPEPIARHPRWTMWGHNGPTPRTSAYAVELPALDLRGVYVPPAAEEAGEGVGSWHWYVGDEAEPTAVTPLTLRLASPGPASAVQAHLRPPLAAGAAHANAVAALDAAPWSAGLRWRADGDDLYVFGPPRTQDPEDVFAAGLRPPGERPVHVAAHVREGGAADSLWVTASRDIGWLRGQASAGEGADGAAVLDRYGWRYDIAAPGGVDVNETLDLAAPHPERREVLFPGGVDGRYVRGVQRVERGRPVGPYLTNPGFSDIRESGTVTKGTAG